ncbi:glycosyl transferase [Thermoplasma sp. Kam2015]|uniref:glycosyltransferase n=1 Tax=Thermoplasma sp. Kam2015 TaxID=2094122 RepID=UPI000D982303|nr:glycosyltransferase [Thermoplasma sp. Kam2015]PYB68117.1 glycosyl transferase [Thermoplasma sp. Kam2015]
MRILYFTDTYYPTPDGVSVYLKEVKDKLESEGHEVMIFSLTGDKREHNVYIPRLTVPFLPYPQYRVPFFFLPFSIFRRAIEFDPDIIHLHNAFYMSSIGYLVARRLGIPPVATFHTDISKMKDSINMPFQDFAFSLGERYSMYLYRKCRVVMAPSKVVEEYLRRNGVNNVITLPLFVDTDKYRCSQYIPEEKYILYLGRITVDKGVYRVLDLAEAMKSDGVKFKIAGIGPELDRIKRIVHAHQMKNVEILGYVDDEKKRELMENASMFVYPSSADTFGISVFEALSSGVPVMVSNDFPVKEDSEAISYVDFNDVRSAQESAKRILSADRRKLATEARRIVENKYSLERHISSLLEIYSYVEAEGEERGSTEKARSDSYIFR